MGSVILNVVKNLAESLALFVRGILRVAQDDKNGIILLAKVKFRVYFQPWGTPRWGETLQPPRVSSVRMP